MAQKNGGSSQANMAHEAYDLVADLLEKDPDSAALLCFSMQAWHMRGNPMLRMDAPTAKNERFYRQIKLEDGTVYIYNKWTPMAMKELRGAVKALSEAMEEE